MLRSDRSEPTVIPYIFAEAEGAVAEPAAESQPAAPSLQEAYAAQHTGADESQAEKKSRRRAESTERNTTLAQEENTARGIAESTRKPQRREQTLAEAWDGVQPDEEVPLGADTLPASLAGYDPDVVEAVMTRMGLGYGDLEDEKLVAALQTALEMQADANPGEEEETGDDSDETEGEEKKPTEEAKPEEKKADLPAPQSVAEYVGNDPEKLKVLNEHIEATYQRARSINDPVMSDVFVTGLAKALQTPAEQVPMLKEVVDVLSYGGYAMVEAAVPKLLPALVDGYMNAHFYPLMEHFLPGLQERHAEQTVQSIWGETLEQEEFSGKDLPNFGTPEFQEAAKSVHEKNPWLDTFDPKGPDGKSLPMLQALRAKAAVTARLLVGERVDSKKIAQQMVDAMAVARKSAEKTTRRVSAGRTLGRGGKSIGTMSKAKSEGESLIQAFRRGSGLGEDGGVI